MGFASLTKQARTRLQFCLPGRLLPGAIAATAMPPPMAIFRSPPLRPAALIECDRSESPKVEHATGGNAGNHDRNRVGAENAFSKLLADVSSRQMTSSVLD